MNKPPDTFSSQPLTYIHFKYGTLIKISEKDITSSPELRPEVHIGATSSSLWNIHYGGDSITWANHDQIMASNNLPYFCKQELILHLIEPFKYKEGSIEI